MSDSDMANLGKLALRQGHIYERILNELLAAGMPREKAEAEARRRAAVRAVFSNEERP